MTVDMSPGAVTARLMRLAELSPLALPHRSSLDMSPEAVEQRLREVGQLHAFYLKLQRSRGGAVETAAQPSGDRGDG